jgi:hypothetical protein
MKLEKSDWQNQIKESVLTESKNPSSKEKLRLRDIERRTFASRF